MVSTTTSAIPFQVSLTSGCTAKLMAIVGCSGNVCVNAELKRSPAFWAKLGHHPYWPAKVRHTSMLSLRWHTPSPGRLESASTLLGVFMVWGAHEAVPMSWFR